ncbi:Undecaprenyl-phosphate 4-deoxy-4-formamido-L-arabinose transferase [subsurface metagenome]
MKNLSIIICSYNEEKTVCDVVKACREFNKKSEILVIDDGSEDNSEELLRELNQTIDFKYIKLPENRGKSYAMTLGVKKASNEIILFFDADSRGIREEHFQDMLKPIIEDQADMVLGHTAATLINYKLTPFKSFTGERVLHKKDLIPILDDIQDLRFGIETYINLYYQTHGKRIKYVLLEGLRTLTKFEKTTVMKATKQYFSEGNEIATTILKNYISIAKIVGSSLNNTNKSMKNKLVTVQKNINKKIQSLSDRLYR